MASSHFSVIYDANVLYPAPLRDFLMHLATTTGLFRAKWSDDIHEEWIRNLTQNRPDIPIDKIQRIRNSEVNVDMEKICMISQTA